MRDLITEAFKNVLDREMAEEALVRDEIRQRGTYWAAAELCSLRRQIKVLRNQLADRDGQ